MIRCPYCGESYYREEYSTRTALMWYPVYKDGKLISRDPNITTTRCTCMNCGNAFSYSNKEPEDELEVRPL